MVHQGYIKFIRKRVLVGGVEYIVRDFSPRYFFYDDGLGKGARAWSHVQVLRVPSGALMLGYTASLLAITRDVYAVDGKFIVVVRRLGVEAIAFFGMSVLHFLGVASRE